MIKLKDILLEMENPPQPRISKREEDQAVQFIKRVSIPYAVHIWNIKSPQHWKLTDNDLKKVLKKVNHETGPGGDRIIYKTQFQAKGSFRKILDSKKTHEFVFLIFMTEENFTSKLTAAVKLNLQMMHGDKAWYVR